MRRILRRYVTRDPAGRVIADRSERLTDDEAGRLRLHAEEAALRCSGCGRPVIELSELRGTCDGCGARGCCVHCVGRCDMCARRLCGRCRHGFAGAPPQTVCATCFRRLSERQKIQEQHEREQALFERHVTLQRLVGQAEALRLAGERLRITACLQAARLGLNPPPPITPHWSRRILRWTAAHGIKAVQHVFRRILP